MNRLILVGTEYPDLSLTLNRRLRAEGFDTPLTGDLTETTRNADERKPFILLLDWALRSFPAVETDREQAGYA